jgi:gamma-glutamyltranspeptidase/glutathione hydrolase
MANNRRGFLKQAGLGLAATGLAGLKVTEAEPKNSGSPSPHDLPHQGTKLVVRGKKAVCSAQHPIVTDTALEVLKAGGNAADAAVAAAITQSTIQLDMTNHTGTVTCLYYNAKEGKIYQLDSAGTLVPHLPLFRPVPVGLLGSPVGVPVAVIPGFMPGIGALHQKFGSRPWRSLVEHAIPWAENGHPMDEFTRSVLEEELAFNTFFPSARAIYTPNGFTPSVGELWKNPALAKTLRRLADEGPEYFTKGEWGQHLVQTANKMGWHIKLEDLSANPPRWIDPIRFNHKGYEVVSLGPPQIQGVFCSIVLGILKHLDVARLGHYTESAESLYYMAHALRRGQQEVAMLNDPQFFGVPLDTWLSDDFHAKLADILRATRPKAGVDLTRHVELSSGRSDLEAFGWMTEPPSTTAAYPSGSTELAIVDTEGNWVQLMNTLQGGGIPGTAVDGVPMYGANASQWLGLPGSRVVQPIGNTIVFKGGKPFISMGSPGNVVFTVPQVLSNVLDYDKDPYDAVALPRLSPMREDHTIEIETRIQTRVLKDLVKLGARLKPLPPYDYHMGSYQQAWRDQKTGLLGASTDPRRIGQAGGY